MFLLNRSKRGYFLVHIIFIISAIVGNSNRLLVLAKEIASKGTGIEFNNYSTVAFHPFFPYIPPPKPTITTTTTQQNMVMRAWSCHGRTQKEMVDKLVMAKIITSNAVRDVMYKVDRKNFMPPGDGGEANAYIDAPMPIGLGQTISAPHMHAHVLEEILPYIQKSTSAEVSLLDVGCGSGYLTAALGRWLDPNSSISDNKNSDSETPSSIVGKVGKVYGIDVYPDLVERTKQNIKKGDKDLFDKGILTIQTGDGWKGLPDKSPFDAIHVGAAADTFPLNLMMQLRVGGVCVVPVGPEGGIQTLYKIERLTENTKYNKDDFRFTNLLGVRYVPLIHR